MRRDRDDAAGFTLIEILVVLVILPLLLGAVAEVIIVSLQNTTATSSRLSDSANAEVASAYFVRDVQAATFTTTNGALFNSAATYSATTPAICGNGTGRLIIALYHPAQSFGSTSQSPAQDVAYWFQTSSSGAKEIDQIVRYSCTSATAISSTVITDAPAGTLGGSSTAGTATVSADLSPASQTQAAATGWIPTTALTTVTAKSTLPSITVGSTSNFVAGQITALTSVGSQVFTQCTITSATQINCPSASGTLFTGTPIVEATVTGISLMAIEPATNYHFVLTGTPRVQASGQAVNPNPNPGSVPALITFGNGGLYVQDHLDALHVNGLVYTDGGALNCSGSAKNAPLPYVTGPMVSTNGGSCLGIGPATSEPDPIAGLLPPGCFPTLPLGAGKDGLNNWQPGRYTTAITGSLNPGVYELDAGIGAAGITLASNAPAGQGVLIFLPGTGPVPANPNCATATGPLPSVPTGLNLPPLGSGPLPAIFGGNAEMRNIWLWQDVTNDQQISWTANSTADSLCPAGTNHAGQDAGLMYLPGANVNIGGNSAIHTGTLAAASINSVFGDNNIFLSGLTSCS